MKEEVLIRFVKNKKILVVIAVVMVGVIISNMPLSSLANGSNYAEDEAKSIENVTGVKDINTDVYSKDEYVTIADGIDAEIKVPQKGSDNLVVNDAYNVEDSYSMKLPQEVYGEEGKTTENGTIVYASDEKKVTVGVQPLMQNIKNVSFEGVRTTITINDASAAKEYSFRYELDEGSKLVTAADYLGDEYDTGEVYIVNKNDEITTIIEKAWAKDSNGNEIETYYKVKGNELIQVVNFDENTAFPVVADPSAWKVTKCVAAIAGVLVTTIFAAAKIVKIKKYIKALGGLKVTAELIVGGAVTSGEIAGATLTTLKNLIAELTGVASIESACF